MTSSVIAVPGRPGFGALLWWFQGPDTDTEQYQFELDGSACTPAHLIALDSLVTTKGSEIARQTFLMVTAHPVSASGSPHQLKVTWKGQASNVARSRTLPATPNGLNILLASCFYAGNSRLQAPAPLPDKFLPPDNLPHVKMLCGDQIYLDLSLGGVWPSEIREPWQRYQEQWYEPNFLAWMSNGGNLCIPDDHEFWNNYPSTVRVTPWLSKLFKVPGQQVTAQMNEGFLIYQGVLNADPDALLSGTALSVSQLHCFEFPGPHAPAGFSDSLSMLVLDTRTQRSAVTSSPLQFTDDNWLQQTRDRIAQRTGPTLLVTSQPMLDTGGGVESCLADYRIQFNLLWDAIWKCPHQMLLLTGDIHWSRVQEFVSTQGKGLKHYEIVASALARINFASPFDEYGTVSNKITWGATTVPTLRTADSGAACNYAILAFTTTPLGLHCRARWWEIDSDGKHVQLDMTPGMKGVLSAFDITRQLTEINLDLH
jgi:hypothetical protein